MRKLTVLLMLACAWRVVLAAEDPPSPASRDSGATGFPKPYSAPCTEREDVFAFTEKPAVKAVGPDKYEITFATKGNCDITVGIVDSSGVVVRHLGSGVLGANAPAPFQKNSLRQTIYWNGKDDLDVYHKEPGKLKVRVMLGLKPEFDKRLGGTSPKNLPGNIYGITASETGVFVMTLGQRYYIRKFDHDGNYLMSLVPPPANLPESKVEGMGYVEYEPGQRAIHFSGNLDDTVSNAGSFLPTGLGGTFGSSCPPVVVGDRLFYATKFRDIGVWQRARWTLNHVYLDGSTSLNGCLPRDLFPLTGQPWDTPANAESLSCAVSPDGRQLYFIGFGSNHGFDYAVWRGELDSDKTATLFLGGKEPGSAEGKFSGTMSLDCDAQGRLYVCDAMNNRVQVFSPEGKFLKSISADRPRTIAVHRKTGAVYLLHTVRVEGKSVCRVTKYRSLDDPTPVAHADVTSDIMALDSWAPKPRLWLNGRRVAVRDDGRPVYDGLAIWEEEGNTFKKISDFAEEVNKADGANRIGWSGGIGDKVVCDPVREQVYFRNSFVFDLKTGALLFENPSSGDDVAFDKRGYMHCHFNPGFFQPGVGRLDPGQAFPRPWVPDHGERVKPWSRMVFKECPYDYGVEGSKGGWIGVLPCRDQPGAKYFQDGIGVNMMGDVAEQCNIYYAPKMEAEGEAFVMAHATRGEEHNATSVRSVMEMQKRGEEVYSIRRQPGVSVLGATVWTFERNGELRQECAVNTGGLINGVQIDEDGKLYFVCGREKAFGGKAFLAGRGGIFGLSAATLYRDPPSQTFGTLRNPFTGTLVKSAGKDVRILAANAPVPLDEKPARPPDFAGRVSGLAWVEGAEWLYAGASPITHDACSCPTMRHHTDWYKRSFVPEAYRHSIGVLDANGNLVLHIGRYGNFDSGDGPRSKIPVGGDGIAIAFNRFVSSTDNYMVFDNHGERLVVLKLNYHVEETVGISNQ